MRQVNLSTLLPDIALRFRREQKGLLIPLFLTIPPYLPIFPWIDNGLETLICTICDCVISKSYQERPVRVAVSQKADIPDLSELLKFRPSSWIQLRIDVQSASESGDDVRGKLKDLGYLCLDEWTDENSTSRLTVYARANHADPQFVLWIQNHKASHRYILLIPLSGSEKPAH